MIPALIQSIMDIYNKVQHNLPIWLNQLAAYGIDTAMLEEWLKNAEQGQLLQKLIVGVGNWVPTIFSAAASTASVGNLSPDGTAYHRQTTEQGTGSQLATYYLSENSGYGKFDLSDFPEFPVWAVLGSGHSGNIDVHRLCNLRNFLCGADRRFDGSLFVYSLCGGILGMLHRSTAEPDD